MSQTIADSSRRLIDAFNRNDADAVKDLVADDFVDHHVPPAIPLGLDGIRMWWGFLHEAFDCRLDIDDVVEGSDRVASRMTFSGTHTGDFQGHPATGASFTASFMGIERYEGGRLVERWEVGDVLGLLQQLGIVEPG
jgi:predicted ester cyclase